MMNEGLSFQVRSRCVWFWVGKQKMKLKNKRGREDVVWVLLVLGMGVKMVQMPF
jgi:hypothetical protein